MSIIVQPDFDFVGQVITDIINTLGRSVTFYYVVSHDICPVCSGSDPFCPTCHGNPYVETEGTFTVTATVKWKLGTLPESKRYRPEGQYLQGDCQLVIEYDESYPTIIDKSRKVVIDGRDCVIRGYYFRGEPTANRIYVIVDEDQRTDGSYRV